MPTHVHCWGVATLHVARVLVQQHSDEENDSPVRWVTFTDSSTKAKQLQQVCMLTTGLDQNVYLSQTSLILILISYNTLFFLMVVSYYCVSVTLLALLMILKELHQFHVSVTIIEVCSHFQSLTSTLWCQIILHLSLQGPHVNPQYTVDK